MYNISYHDANNDFPYALRCLFDGTFLLLYLHITCANTNIETVETSTVSIGIYVPVRPAYRDECWIAHAAWYNLFKTSDDVYG